MTVVCNWCNNEVLKKNKELRRCLRRGQQNFFCNRSCVARYKNKLNPPPGNKANLVANNRKDALTPFRWFLARIRYRVSKGSSDITEAYLQDLWTQQNGVCPITKWSMVLPKNKVERKNASARVRMRFASLDRIDNSLGYVCGNVRFITLMANFARNSFSDEDLFAFCAATTAAQNLSWP